MNKFSLKEIIVRGIALALPLAVVAYVVVHFLVVFENVIAPFANKLGVASIFGKMTLAVLAILCMALLVFVMGLLMSFSFVANSSKLMEDAILKMVPSLNHLKLLAAEKLHIENEASAWKPVLLKTKEGFVPAYLIEEKGAMATFSKIKTPGTEPGEIIIASKEETVYTEISMAALSQCNKQFGKGYIALMENQSYGNR